MPLYGVVNSPCRSHCRAAATLLVSVSLLCSCFAIAMPSVVVTVDQSGKGDHRRIQDAIDAAPANDSSRTVIRIKPGVYRRVGNQ